MQFFLLESAYLSKAHGPNDIQTYYWYLLFLQAASYWQDCWYFTWIYSKKFARRAGYEKTQRTAPPLCALRLVRASGAPRDLMKFPCQSLKLKIYLNNHIHHSRVSISKSSRQYSFMSEVVCIIWTCPMFTFSNLPKMFYVLYETSNDTSFDQNKKNMTIIVPIIMKVVCHWLLVSRYLKFYKINRIWILYNETTRNPLNSWILCDFLKLTFYYCTF